jgi:hypothetical protein
MHGSWSNFGGDGVLNPESRNSPWIRGVGSAMYCGGDLKVHRLVVVLSPTTGAHSLDCLPQLLDFRPVLVAIWKIKMSQFPVLFPDTGAGNRWPHVIFFSQFPFSTLKPPNGFPKIGNGISKDP